MTTASNQNITAGRPTDGGRHFGSVLAIAMVVAITQGWSVGDGLFLDDHWHQLQLQQAEWSPASLMSTTTIEPARFIHAWWQDLPVRWDYSRPLTMAWMKAVQQFSGGSVALQHLSSIFWHLVTCVLVYLVAFQVTGHRWWSSFAGSLFAAYSHTAFTVGWLAAQNAIIQTALTLAALLLYMQASGLRAAPRTVGPGSAAGPNTANGAGRPAGRRFVCALLVFIASLFCRENAVMFPVLAVCADLAYGGLKTVRARLRWYGLLFGIAALFAAWRLAAFESHIPQTYFRRPQALADLWWYLAKLLHYVVCTVWETPMFIGPMRYENPFLEAPRDCALMLAIAAVLGVGLVLACHRTVRGYWLWPVWIVASLLPVVPIMATPHSGYMAGVGFVIALVLKPAAVPARRARLSIAAAVWFVFLSVFALLVYRSLWRGVLRGEQYVIAHMIAQEAPPADSDVFIINLPLTNIYMPIILQQAWNLTPHQLRTHVLTYAPHLLMGPQRCQVRQVDPHTFILSSPEEPYYSGLLGRFLSVDMRQEGAFKNAEFITTDLFDVTILQADDHGVSAMKFTFHQPLSSPGYRFYMISANCGAAELRFAGDWLLDGTAENLVFEAGACAGFEEARQDRDRVSRIIEYAGRIIRTDLYRTAHLDSSK